MIYRGFKFTQAFVNDISAANQASVSLLSSLRASISGSVAVRRCARSAETALDQKNCEYLRPNWCSLSN